MNMKHISLFLLLFSAGIATAGCGECFSGKSLEELEAMHKKQMEEVDTTFEAKQFKAVLQEYDKSQDKLSKAKLNCTAHKERSVFTASLIGASQYDCDLITQFQEEFFELEKIKEYAEQQFNNTKNSELKALKECIIARKAKQIVEKSGSL